MKTEMFFTLVASALLVAGCGKASSGKYSRGLGIYPGNPDESFAPEMVQADETYRNVAKWKAAYHSSSYDYNLTAQLITDGIISEQQPALLNVSTQNGKLKKNEREWFFDGKPDSKYEIVGNDIYLQFDFENLPIDADRVVLHGDVAVNEQLAGGYEIMAYGLGKESEWEQIAVRKGNGLLGEQPATPRRRSSRTLPKQDPASSPVIFKYNYQPKNTEPAAMSFRNNRTARPFTCEFKLPKDCLFKSYKFVFKMPAAKDWTFNTVDFYKGNELLTVLPSAYFNSVWQSASSGKEWVYVDLGTPTEYDKVVLHWLTKATEGQLQSSNDAKTWKQIAALPGGKERKDVIKLDKAEKSRYVRLVLNRSESDSPYQLSEFEIYGKGGLIPQPKAIPDRIGNRQYLSGGSWKLQRASLVSRSGEDLSKPGYKDEDWVPATVPGTVLSSYLNIGAIPDPNFADNQLQISESFFLSDFWYRNEFVVEYPVEYAFLNFDGINWKANVYLNGRKIGRIDGAFMRGKFDVSDLLVQGKNAIAVQIIKNAHPGAVKEQTAYSTDQNGGIPGADNPTFHASIGWDWIPTIRGRNIGIWNDVFLSYHGAVTMEDPFVRTELPLPDTTSADVFVEVTLKNHSSSQVAGLLKGRYGDASFEAPVTLAGHEEQLVKLDANQIPALHLRNPKLWWPKGYGEPHLYDVNLNFEVNGEVTDELKFKSGVRQMTYSEDEYTPSGGMPMGTFGISQPKRLSLYINGRRFIGFGGNWGFGESNLNYRKREYDIAVAYHADMNFTMIRNWVGQIGDEEFYDACDRHGVMVWQDFWLANPVDGPNPYDVTMFNNNALDYVKRIRNHPSIAIYVGRNEGNPPKEIDDYLRGMVAKEHDGLYYISNSAMGVVSGGGPYRALPIESYFQTYGHDKFHSERGMPNVMNYESMLRAFGTNNMEPVSTLATPNFMYGLHDYTLGGTSKASAQAAESFNEMMRQAFGQPKDAKQFAEWAQWINYNGYRAIFEGRSEHRRGMLLWMSHPAWPSMVWQTYDYYFDPTAAYFACKKATESIHIQWNPVRDDIEVVNYHAHDLTGLQAKAYLINQDGSIQWEKTLQLDIQEDQTVACFPLEMPSTLSDTYFIKLQLVDLDGNLLSDNFYWRGKEEGNYRSLLMLPKTEVEQKISMVNNDDEWLLQATLRNNSQVPALMLRLKMQGKDTGRQLLPVFYSDNYFSLLPREEKTVSIRFSDRDTHGETPLLVVTGFNVE